MREVARNMRLDKFLADLQIGTRSQVKDFIKKGLVTVNDETITKADFKVNESLDTVTCKGTTLSYQKYRYFLLHKPAGVVTATRDHHDKTVMDLLPKELHADFFPVGRLDKDTEGFLLITNDGALSHQLLSPKKHVAKTYYVECQGVLTSQKIQLLENGVNIGDEKPTLPAIVKEISKEADSYVIHLTITEGRFHQVKRMIQAIGGEVTYLKRLSMGGLSLDETLEKGSYRELSLDEIAVLSNS